MKFGRDEHEDPETDRRQDVFTSDMQRYAGLCVQVVDEGSINRTYKMLPRRDQGGREQKYKDT